MFEEFFSLAWQDKERFVTAVLVMVSAVIVFMGILKSLLLNKIPNKEVRGVVLSFASLALMFGATAILFLCYTIDWQYYVAFSAVNCGAMIITYWLYENTKLRLAIHTIGSVVLEKISNAIVSKVNSVAKNTEAIGSVFDEILKNSAKKVDDIGKDLKNL